MPLVMKVLEPLITYSSPSRTAVVPMEARSDPMPGSVMATAVTSSPEAMPGSQRAFCSSLQYSRKYGRQTSVCRVSPMPCGNMSAFDSSSMMIWL